MLFFLLSFTNAGTAAPEELVGRQPRRRRRYKSPVGPKEEVRLPEITIPVSLDELKARVNQLLSTVVVRNDLYMVRAEVDELKRELAAAKQRRFDKWFRREVARVEAEIEAETDDEEAMYLLH